MSPSTSPERPRVLFVCNNPDFLVSHRLSLATGIRDAGYDVHVAGPAGPGIGRIREAGLPYHEVSLVRGFQNPLQELRTIAELGRLYDALRPDLIHHLTIKPVIYGSLAAAFTTRPIVVNAITGLGYGFLAEGARGLLLRKAVSILYRLAFSSRRSMGLFQNEEDRNLFVRGCGVPRERTRVVPGTGVDPKVFKVAPEPPGPVKVLLPARLLRHKGIREYAEAGRILKERGVPVTLAIAGEPDPKNPASIPLEEVRDWERRGWIEYWGRVDDMPAAYAKVHIVCLPSYREGFPRVLLEAAACGRALVATNVPGCRDFIRNGINGLLCRVADPTGLSSTLESLVREPRTRDRLASTAREDLESTFSIRELLRQTLTLYSDAGAPVRESTQVPPGNGLSYGKLNLP
jgi:glycosyltransferase involved in cell wall biosynthesis